MANRRMFSKDIVRSDDFLDMSITAQLLYFQMGMEADDRGYVNNVRSLIRILGINKGDLEQLVQKRFVLVRGENLILIKGWRINNTIQPTRMVESKYASDLALLYLDEANSYTESETPSPCRQLVNKPSTQISIGKDSRGKRSKVQVRIDEISGDDISYGMGSACADADAVGDGTSKTKKEIALEKLKRLGFSPEEALSDEQRAIADAQWVDNDEPF